jgi:hypothetical protein
MLSGLPGLSGGSTYTRKEGRKEVLQTYQNQKEERGDSCKRDFSIRAIRANSAAIIRIGHSLLDAGPVSRAAAERGCHMKMIHG